MLTNNSIYTPRDLRYRLLNSGLDIPADAIWTSALATATFLGDQRPEGSAYVIGEAGPDHRAARDRLRAHQPSPDYVVLGETRTYSFEAVTTAIRLIQGGARFVATNPDPTGPSMEGDLPATGSVAALISKATGVEPYFVGKPNPLMMRAALNRLQAHSETTVMIGDRMDTDVVAGLEAGMRTVLVLTGITHAARRRPLPVPAEPRSWTRSRTWWTSCRRCKPRWWSPDGPRRRARRRGPTGGEGIPPAETLPVADRNRRGLGR